LIGCRSHSQPHRAGPAASPARVEPVGIPAGLHADIARRTAPLGAAGWSPQPEIPIRQKAAAFARMPEMSMSIPPAQACPMAAGCQPHELNSVQK